MAKSKAKKKLSERMKPFIGTEMRPPSEETVERLRKEAASLGMDFEHEVAPRLFNHPGELFVNDRFDVIRERFGPMWHLSIRPHEPNRGRLWHEFQQIKNELVGPDNEGVELFPAEDRLVDTADQYHLWIVADPTYRFPFGYSDGRLVTDPE